MFVIELDDEWLLDDFANFLEYKLPGVVTRDSGHRLLVDLRGCLAPIVQERVLRRLHWAWRVEHGVEAAPARFTHVAVTLAGESAKRT
jgi:hypothetical protein